MNASPALVLHFPSSTPAGLRDRLVALFADHDLVAIHEDDIGAPRTWTAHFAGAEARDAAEAAVRALPEFSDLRLERVEIEDEDWA
ncbi:MAG TPA: hypothetical protein VG106_09325, partial [Vicinamibacterales bacterium]|nr:hypothetical protein [Vicinamibacterales bacterium]